MAQSTPTSSPPSNPGTWSWWLCKKCYQKFPSIHQPCDSTPSPPVNLCSANLGLGIPSMNCEYERLTPTGSRNAAMTIILESQERGPLDRALYYDDSVHSSYLAPNHQMAMWSDMHWVDECTAPECGGLGKHTFRDCCIGAKCVSSSCGVGGEHTYGDCTIKRPEGLMSEEMIEEMIKEVLADVRTSKNSRKKERVGVRRSARLAAKQKPSYVSGGRSKK